MDLVVLVDRDVVQVAVAVEQHQNAAADRRIRRMERMVLKLQQLGVNITMEEVRIAAGPAVNAADAASPPASSAK